MVIVGIDLSGPTNSKETAYVSFATAGDELYLLEAAVGLADAPIFERISALAACAPVAVGLDAPLSYNQGGGDRPADRALRRLVAAKGPQSVAIMAPTMTRMVYLTLRGIAMARALGMIAPHPPAIVEVHPGAALVLRGAPPGAVRAFKKQREAREVLLAWLEEQGLRGCSALSLDSDHVVAAAAAALAAWQWRSGQAVWLVPARPPFHPFDYAC